jgi:hypothetical protein
MTRAEPDADTRRGLRLRAQVVCLDGEALWVHPEAVGAAAEWMAILDAAGNPPTLRYIERPADGAARSPAEKDAGRPREPSERPSGGHAQSAPEEPPTVHAPP